jgi:hypothetical protein
MKHMLSKITYHVDMILYMFVYKYKHIQCICIYGQSAPGGPFHCESAVGVEVFQFTLSFGVDLICVQNWMGMVSFLSSPVLGTFWSKKVKKIYSERCPF